MSKNVSAIAEAMFDAEIKHTFQDVTTGLRNTVRVKINSTLFFGA